MSDKTSKPYSDTQEAILEIIQNANGERVTKKELIIKLRKLGHYSNSTRDTNIERDIRLRISDLRLAGYPIQSSSKTKGYKYTNDEIEIDRMISDLLSRSNKISKVAGALIRTRRAIKEGKHEYSRASSQ